MSLFKGWANSFAVVFNTFAELLPKHTQKQLSPNSTAGLHSFKNTAKPWEERKTHLGLKQSQFPALHSPWNWSLQISFNCIFSLWSRAGRRPTCAVGSVVPIEERILRSKGTKVSTAFGLPHLTRTQVALTCIWGCKAGWHAWAVISPGNLMSLAGADVHLLRLSESFKCATWRWCALVINNSHGTRSRVIRSTCYRLAAINGKLSA